MHLQTTSQVADDATPAPIAKAAAAESAEGPVPCVSPDPAAAPEVGANSKDAEADGDAEWVGNAADDEADDEVTLEEEEVGIRTRRRLGCVPDLIWCSASKQHAVSLWLRLDTVCVTLDRHLPRLRERDEHSMLRK